MNVKTKYLHCGCCGSYHRAEYHGDCRNDAERFTIENLEDLGIFDEILVMDLLDEDSDRTRTKRAL